MHQLCDACTRLGREAYIVYIEWGVLPPEHGPLFADAYEGLRWAELRDVRDGPDVTIVVPEVMLPAPIVARFPTSRLVWWWLSWDNGRQNVARLLDGGLARRFEHVFQSRYAQGMVQRELGVAGFMLPDYVNERQFARPSGHGQGQRYAVVVYNALKDAVIAPAACERAGVRSVALRDMTRAEVIEAMSGAMVYVDMGAHPGRDRMPREAALLGCVVVTGRGGSAGCDADVPIAEKCADGAELEALLPRVLADYEGYRARQQLLLHVTHADRARFDDRVAEACARWTARDTPASGANQGKFNVNGSS